MPVSAGRSVSAALSCRFAAFVRTVVCANRRLINCPIGLVGLLRWDVSDMALLSLPSCAVSYDALVVALCHNVAFLLLVRKSDRSEIEYPEGILLKGST